MLVVIHECEVKQRSSDRMQYKGMSEHEQLTSWSILEDFHMLHLPNPACDFRYGVRLVATPIVCDASGLHKPGVACANEVSGPL